MMAIMATLVPSISSAQDGAFPALTNDVLVWSARTCYVESTWSLNDCAALLHVIRKRAAKLGWPFLKMLKAYSYVHWQGKKAVEAKQLHATSVKKKDALWNQNWFKLVQHVKAVFEMNIKDPCPKADHWAAKWYEPKSPMKRAKCAVALENAFWISVKEQHT